MKINFGKNTKYSTLWKFALLGASKFWELHLNTTQCTKESLVLAVFSHITSCFLSVNYRLSWSYSKDTSDLGSDPHLHPHVTCDIKSYQVQPWNWLDGCTETHFLASNESMKRHESVVHPRPKTGLGIQWACGELPPSRTQNHNAELLQRLWSSKSDYIFSLNLCLQLHTHIHSECWERRQWIIDLVQYLNRSYLDRSEQSSYCPMFYIKTAELEKRNEMRSVKCGCVPVLTDWR